MRSIKTVLISAAMLAACMPLSAQYTVSGRVLDRYASPISDAKVRGKGMATYVETAIDGSFLLETAVPVKRLEVTAFGKAPRLLKKKKKGETKVVMDDLTWYNEKQDYYRWFALLECGLLSKDSKDVPFGIMFGQSKKFGWYGKIMFSGIPATSGVLNSNYNSDLSLYNSRTGNVKTGLFSAVAGGVARIKGPVSAYLGLGYAYRKVAIECFNSETNQTDWYVIKYNYDGMNIQSIEGASLDAGVMMNCNYVTWNLGYTVLGGERRTMGTVHFGVGYTF